MFAEVFLLVVSVVAWVIYSLLSAPSSYELDAISMSEVSESDLAGPFTLGCIRTVFACVVWWACVTIYCDENGLQINILNVRTGKLSLFTMKHSSRFTPFTVWTWVLLGVYFSVAALCSFCRYYGTNLPHWIVCLTAILFQLVFSCSYLVTAVVTFVLIPGGVKRGIPVASFYYFMSLLFHNANVAMIFVDMLLNNISFRTYHFMFVMFYGCCYIIFAWYWHRVAGIFYYFFLDYARPDAFFWHAGLLLTVSAFFFLGKFASDACTTPRACFLAGLGTCLIMKLRPSLKTRAKA